MQKENNALIFAALLIISVIGIVFPVNRESDFWLDVALLMFALAIPLNGAFLMLYRHDHLAFAKQIPPGFTLGASVAMFLPYVGVLMILLHLNWIAALFYLLGTYSAIQLYSNLKQKTG
ncbi:MAG TPA: hypothetical protein VJZ27_15730 [Aggregatilineales bacterium]|nr:hypothetical protein [Aggregatilineales bacterium]